VPTKKKCVGKLCKLTKRHCQYRGPVYTQRRVKRCKWANRTRRIRQVKCCRFTINCRINHLTKSKKCLKRARKCRWVGRKIKSKRFRTCTFKAYGKRKVRKHCCSYSRVCKSGRCRHKNIRCSWQGCAKLQTLKNQCQFVHIRKKYYQKTMLFMESK